MGTAILAWLIAKAPEVAIQLAIAILEKTGVISHAKAEMDSAGARVLHVVGSIKTYSSPDDFPKQIKGS